ncbi:probable LRR receptor-like serine/threonine-protein kinase At5g48740 isoform X2 [Hevea brasiliensis]|uniref:probable LRR receptor-like serine/threonine-protein kinase At5g48740 isoform X2 n=1 Tax=Hevea brasiliensis TaxID=3981 RepID=UPI0025FAF13D|nr:probable LRR receptor-like serine/threonine-protein kinase At5g48740 isoform X2 [Hevea brasiliensis]
MDLNCFWVVFILFSGLWILGFCEDQDGFLSLSCGGTTNYTDSSNIRWVLDSAYISTGNTTTIDYIEGTSSSNVPIRFFPRTDQGRKCYKLPVKNMSSVVLVRAQFVYKDYDKLGKPPAFSVSLGTAITSTVNLTISDPWNEEFVWPASKDTLSFCLHAIPDGGSPVISSIEVRPLPQGAYQSGMGDFPNKSLRKSYRINSGYTNGSLRYPLDPYDRIWDADENYTPFHVSIGFNKLLSFNLSSLSENPPLAVLQTARVLARRKVLTYNLALDTLGDYYIVLYFAGILPVSPSFDIFINGDIAQSNYTVTMSEASALYLTRKGIKSLNITLKSISFYPQINAIEVYEVVDIPSEASSTTVSALQVIQQSTGLDLGWEDDPCSPKSWDHIGCEGSLVTSLDLQNNSLQGTVPDGLGKLEDLHLLNLENNKLQGSLPQSLNKESLEVRTTGNPCLSFSTMSCNDVSSNPSIETPQVTIFTKKKPNKSSHMAIILGAAVGTIFVLLVISLSLFLYTKKQSSGCACTDRALTDMRNWNAARIFSYKEIKAATNNFKEVIGRGSFGSVHLGKLSEGKLVAVKVRFDRTQLGADSFINEVYLLSQIRHQNLVCLEGFCYESKQQILVYEYLPGGSLSDHLYGPNSQKVSLSWVRRLKIAVDAAKGLDYLHNGSEPRIIHRDVKCSNILLDKDMNAKVCDFGLSKQVLQADASHVTTVVKGTAGYLDPEYYSTQQLTEKSDVYGFGVVLLELICGREPLRHSGTPDSFNLVLWAKPHLQAGAFEIVDDSLKGTFDVESMRKAATVAVRSVERDASQRPNIAEVFAELKEAYNIQLSYLAARDM